MRRYLIILCFHFIVPCLVQSQDLSLQHMVYDGETYALYPTQLSEKPNIPSPLTADDGKEHIVCFTRNDKYTIIPVTVENGEPLNYKEDLWSGKGRQLDVDSMDFPTLAATGLHSEAELDRTKTITGRSLSEITGIARPEEYSTIGFIAHDEDILSVLKGDNELVRRLGMTHPELARPLFHIFNVILADRYGSERSGIQGVLYNNREIHLKFGGAKGWQESIFNDEILGYWDIDIWRYLDTAEIAFLSQQYTDLSDDSRADLIRRLSQIHTGEMVPYYVMRYGFYEGHTGYRADPIAVAFIFGLRTLGEIEDEFGGHLYEAITKHHVSDTASINPPDEGL